MEKILSRDLEAIYIDLFIIIIVGTCGVACAVDRAVRGETNSRDLLTVKGNGAHTTVLTEELEYCPIMYMQRIGPVYTAPTRRTVLFIVCFLAHKLSQSIMGLRPV